MKRRNRLSSSAQSPSASPGFLSAIRSLERKDWLFIAALAVAVVVVYQPALHGGVLWDDDEHLTRSELQTWQGLYRIWFDVGATLQYYPLLHSAFWIEHKLWGDATLGYHVVNVLQHIAAALLAALVLRRLKVPGAYLAAAVFALHPIQAETVAWMTEQKNTLSALFYLGSLLAYLRFDQTRKLSTYCWALGLFGLGILSKTIIATLPGALLVIFWWQRGRLSWTKDVLPLVPFFVLGAGGGMITAWWELRLNNCVGPDFTLTVTERFLVAGRTTWFLLWKLVWPTHLMFSYPRWELNAGAWWQYAFPLGAAALLAALWAARRWSRAPLAAALYFGGTLFPMLGFFNLYTFLYSFVANHYQYLACLGVISLASAGFVRLLERWRLWGRPGGYALCLVPLAILSGLTWQQSRMYSDVDTLYRWTIEENPGSWMAYNNLGTVLLDRDQLDEGMRLLQQALKIKPDSKNVHNNIGLGLSKQGKLDEAIVEYRKSLAIRPDYLNAHINLGLALYHQRHYAEAMAEYREAQKINPRFADVYNNMGNVLLAEDKLDEAASEFRKALEIAPGNSSAHNNLGAVLFRQGRLAEARVECQEAVRLNPQSGEAYSNLGNIVLQQAKFEEAIAAYSKALAFRPDYSDSRYNLAVLLYQHGRMAEGIAQLRELVRREPANFTAINQLAWSLATNPDASLRNGRQAVGLAQQAAKLTGGRDPAVFDTLGTALAETGRFAEAVDAARHALALASSQKNGSLVEGIRGRIKLYQGHSPYHETQQSGTPAAHP